MSIEETLKYLDRAEIDYRLTSDHCTGYIFYFLDGSVYPRRWHDAAFEGGTTTTIIEESPEHLLSRVCLTELSKDWKHRIEAETLDELFALVEDYLSNNRQQP